jgi:outer membrane protein assembly factor BamB
VLWDVPGRHAVAGIAHAMEPRARLAFTPDSRFLAMAAAVPPPGAPRGPHLRSGLSLASAADGTVLATVPGGLPPDGPPGVPGGMATAVAAPGEAGGEDTVVVSALYLLTGTRVFVRRLGAGGAGFLAPPRVAATLPPTFSPRAVALAPDGRAAALAGTMRRTGPAGASGTIRLAHVAAVRLSDGAELWRSEQAASAAQAVAWSPDGAIVAVGLSVAVSPPPPQTERVVALDTATGAVRWVARWPQAEVWSVAFSPDGRWLAAASDGSTGEIRVLDVADGTTLLTLSGVSHPWAVAWGPAGSRRLAFGDGPRVRIIEITP